jgi:hypothetical protein
MNEIEIDFNDVIYRETRICGESVAMRWADVKSDDGYIYRLYIKKRQTKNDIDYFISLKDPLDKPVRDLKVTIDYKMLGIDHAKSQDAVVIEQKKDSKQLGSILVESSQEKLRSLVRIKLEEPLSSLPGPQIIKKKELAKKTKRL